MIMLKVDFSSYKNLSFASNILSKISNATSFFFFLNISILSKDHGFCDVLEFNNVKFRIVTSRIIMYIKDMKIADSVFQFYR